MICYQDHQLFHGYCQLSIIFISKLDLLWMSRIPCQCQFFNKIAYPQDKISPFKKKTFPRFTSPKNWLQKKISLIQPKYHKCRSSQFNDTKKNKIQTANVAIQTLPIPSKILTQVHPPVTKIILSPTFTQIIHVPIVPMIQQYRAPQTPIKKMTKISEYFCNKPSHRIFKNQRPLVKHQSANNIRQTTRKLLKNKESTNTKPQTFKRYDSETDIFRLDHYVPQSPSIPGLAIPKISESSKSLRNSLESKCDNISELRPKTTISSGEVLKQQAKSQQSQVIGSLKMIEGTNHYYLQSH